MNKNPGNLAQTLTELQANTTDRLRDLLSSFSALRSNNRTLVAQLRGSIYELREHRRRFKQQQSRRRRYRARRHPIQRWISRR